VLHARQDFARIRRLLLVTTRLNSYLSMSAVVVTYLFGEELVRVWVGPAYLAVTLPVLKILLVAQAIRLVGSAYGTMLVAMGLQRYGLMPVMVEGVLNLLLSLLGMILIGPAGVAWATLAAASIAIGMTILIVMPRVKEVYVSRRLFVWQGILLPLLPFLPICIWMFFRRWGEDEFYLSHLSRWYSLAALLTITTWLTWDGVHRTFREVNSV
jgi:O-antigen/teichoic acid export membrane protein